MISFDLALFNYRCFSNENPARIQMRPGLTSLVGPNNSGKSTFLRFFFELRPIFFSLSNPVIVMNLGRSQSISHLASSVGDPLEIFHNGNSLPIRIEIRIPGAADNQISGIDLTSTRQHPEQWTAQFTLGPKHIHFPNKPDFPTIQPSGQRPRENADTSLITALASDISNSLYLPVTRTAAGESTGNAYDLTFGTAFIGLWDAWKTGKSRFQNEMIQVITEDIARLFDFRRLEITATPDNKDLHLSIDGKSFKLRELGSGLTQFIMVLGNVATRKPTWVFIDEPEISLHPSLQLDFLTTLSSYDVSGTIFATHSLGLARSADRAFSVQKKSNNAIVRPFESTPTLSEFLGEMSFAAYRELGYDSVLLVEGVNDIKPVQQFLRLLNREHSVVLLHLGGSQMIRREREAELTEVLRLSKNVHVLIDREKNSSDSEISEQRRAFLSQCERLGIRALATSRRAIEHYLTDRAIKIAFGNSYRALTEFEPRSDVNPIWAKALNWRAAREMTKEELLMTDVGEFLNTISSGSAAKQ